MDFEERLKQLLGRIWLGIFAIGTILFILWLGKMVYELYPAFIRLGFLRIVGSSMMILVIIGLIITIGTMFLKLILMYIGVIPDED